MKQNLQCQKRSKGQNLYLLYSEDNEKTFPLNQNLEKGVVIFLFAYSILILFLLHFNFYGYSCVSLFEAGSSSPSASSLPGPCRDLIWAGAKD